MSLLTATGLTKVYPVGRRRLGRERRFVRAVDGVDLALEAGETLSLVGESGAGKSTVGRLLLRLIEPDSGTITFAGSDVSKLRPAEMRSMRRKLQMIFQDPYSSLDPRARIVDSVAEPLWIHDRATRRDRQRQAMVLLERVGISAAMAGRYPRELSGGQLQRAAIARALTLRPEVIVCDEPVAALDVSVRAQVLNLMRDLQIERGLSYLFISHDLSLVEVISDRVAVMSAGRIVELDAAERLFREPQHDYTRQLLAAVPNLVPRALRRG